MVSDKKTTPNINSAFSFSDRIREWFKRNSKVVTIIMVLAVVVVGTVFFLNLNSSNREKSANERLKVSLVKMQSRPHIIAPVIVDDNQIIISIGTPATTPAELILNKLNRDGMEIRALDPDSTNLAMTKLGLNKDSVQEPMKASELGKELSVDYVLITKPAVGMPPVGRAFTGTGMVGSNHWKVLLVEVTTAQPIGQGEVWLEGSEESPRPNSNFTMITRPYQTHTPNTEQMITAAEELKGLTESFGDTPSGKMAALFCGDAYYQAGKFEDAMNAFTMAEKKVGDLEMVFQCQLGKADSLTALGKYDEAIASYEELLNDKSATAKAMQPGILLRIADCHEMKNDKENGEKVLAKLLKEHSESPWLDMARQRYQELYY